MTPPSSPIATTFRTTVGLLANVWLSAGSSFVITKKVHQVTGSARAPLRGTWAPARAPSIWTLTDVARVSNKPNGNMDSRERASCTSAVPYGGPESQRVSDCPLLNRTLDHALTAASSGRWRGVQLRRLRLRAGHSRDSSRSPQCTHRSGTRLVLLEGGARHPGEAWERDMSDRHRHYCAPCAARRGYQDD